MANPTTTPIMTPARGPNVPDAQPVYLVDQYGNPVASYALYTAAQASVGSGNSGPLPVAALKELSIDITTTLVTTNLQFFWERQGADLNWYPIWQSAVLTTSANTLSTSIGAGLAYNQSLGAIGRLRWVATGNASFTPNIFGK